VTVITLPPDQAPQPAPEEPDVPREIDPGRSTSDKVFRSTARSIGIFVLVLTGAIGLFLGYQGIPTLRRYGLGFFTQSQWQPELDKIGISSALVGTFEVAAVAMIVSFPLALLTAIFISEYAPSWIKSWLTSAVDLMAAVPSIIYGLWGFFFLQANTIYLSRWLHQHLGFLPIFRVDTDPNAAAWAQSRYTSSAFIAGLCVSMMVIPLATAIMAGVFRQAPIGEREAAYALGCTRWGMIRTVVLPFGRGGIIGGTMLGLGRALGETVAVLLIISQQFDITFRPLQTGTVTISSLIAGRFGDATSAQLSALLAAGFVLFVITIGINTLAALFINRSRSGSDT
jgi:phosphate transport system permease protein